MLRYGVVLSALICLFHAVTFAQNTCANAEGFCSNSGLTFPAGTNQPAAPAGPNYGCLFSRPNPAWYYMNVSSGGSITITLTNSGNEDIDFIIWGPFSDPNTMCAQVFAGAPIVDCSYSTAATELVDIPNASAGQWYMLLVTNYSNDPTNISANQTAGTGSTNCNVLCSINSMTATPTACDPLDDTFNLSGVINVTNQPTTGFLTITENCYGNSITLPAPFNSSISYTFPDLISNGMPCSVTASFSADPTCTATAGFNAPAPCFVPDCSFLSHTANVSPCDPTTVSYDLSGTLSFEYPPSTGTLTISLCSGEQQVFNAPFNSPVTYSFTGLEPNNTQCTVSASFSAEAQCTYSFGIQEPFPCSCPVQVGTFGLSGGSNGVYCFGQTMTLSSQGNFVPPVDVSHPAVAYEPAIGYYVFTCPPTVTDIGFTNDPCYVGLWQTGSSVSQVNDGTFFSQFPGVSFTGNQFYIVPVTLYNRTTEAVSVTVWAGECFDMGEPVAVRFLNDMNTSITENCPDGEVAVGVSGGAPEWSLGHYTISNIQPAIVNPAIYSVGAGDEFVLENMQDGMNYSFVVHDQFNCSVSRSNGPFMGPVEPTLTAVPVVCSEDDAFYLQADPPGGAWYGPGVNSAGLFNPSIAGPGNHAVSYLPAGCAVSDNMNVSVLYQPDATILTIPSKCIYDGAFNMSAVDQGGYWSGNGVTNPVTGIFSPGSAGIGTHAITYTINGYCSDTKSYNVVVNPRPDATFSASVTEGCTPMPVTFTYTGSSVPAFCNWEANDISIGTACSAYTHVFPARGCYDIRYTITDINGCQNSHETDDLICLVETPMAAFGYDLEGVNVLNPEVSFTNYSSYATSYVWDFGGQDAQSDLNPVFRFDIARGTTIPVCLRAVNDLGCMDTHCEDVVIPEVFFFYVPNTFTPNGDGFNDVFQPSVNGVAGNQVYEYEFEVFSKWGEKVYRSTDPNDVWVGDKNGSEYFLPDGVYYWQARIRFDVLEAPRRYEGHLLILR